MNSKQTRQRRRALLKKHSDQILKIQVLRRFDGRHAPSDLVLAEHLEREAYEDRIDKMFRPKKKQR